MTAVTPFYPLIMLAALVAGLALSRGRQKRLGLTRRQGWAVAIGAFCGGMIGSKLPFAIAAPDGLFCQQAWLTDGKTILFGLVGGYIGVEFAKWQTGVTTKTGDSFALPVAVAIAIGRLGCFAVGCCYGRPTSLPWGVDFGDHIRRHPTQLYETLFHLGAAAGIVWLERRGLFPTQRLKLYFIAYCVYRFLTEFIRPERPILLGLTVYQWTTLALIPLLVWLWNRDARDQMATVAER